MRNFTRHSSSREEDRRYSPHRCPPRNCIFTMEPRAMQGTRGNRSPCCAAFIAAPYIGALSAGCRVARISTIIAGPIINPEGRALDSPKLLVPLPRAARFYCLFSSVRNGGSPLHRPRWRINDPAIRRRAAPRHAALRTRTRFSSPPHCLYPRLRCLRVRITRVPSSVYRGISLVWNRSRARKEPAKAGSARAIVASIALVNAPLTRTLDKLVKFAGSVESGDYRRAAKESRGISNLGVAKIHAKIKRKK